MNFKETLEKVQNSETYQTFKQSHPEAQLCAGFFIQDFLSNDNKDSIDYKDQDKIFTFNIINDQIKMYEDKLMDIPNTPKLQPLLKPTTEIEVDQLKSIVQEKAHEEGIGAKFNKIIAVLQTHEENNEKTQIWNLTCMLDQLIILHILIDCTSSEILKFQRKSFMDMIKRR
tara:strand:+ start:162 stop:674 length:513 start_codon:yes stop_codon:yes gene_type:complete